MCKNVKDLIKSEIGISNNISYRDNSTQILPNYRIYKSNKLIESKSDFSAMEHRIIVLALSQIKKSDENLKLYKIQIKDVLGKKHSSHYNTVREAVRKLHKSTIDMEEIDGWKSYSFITMAQGKYRESFIEIQFHEHIQKFLLGLKSHYTTYTLENVINFKRNYSLRIYELCKQYIKISQRVIEINHLKTILSLEKKIAYKDFAQFKRGVLNPACEEINKHSDINVKFIEHHEGRKVVSIKFFMNRKKLPGERVPKTLIELDIFEDNDKKLLSIGFTDNEITFFLRTRYSEERISVVLDLFEKNIETIKFPKPWIENALKENYVDNSAYKKQLSEVKEKHSQMESLMIKKRVAKNKLRDIEELIEIAEEDIQYYETVGELRNGDVMRFSEDFTVEQAIQYMENRIEESKEDMNSVKIEIEELEKSLLVFK